MKTSIKVISMFLGSFLSSCQGLVNGQSSKELMHINSKEISDIVKMKDALIIDVRTPGEINQGFISGTKIFADISSSDFDHSIQKLDTSRTYIVYCRSGARSRAAADKMLAMGFSHLYNLKGGILAYEGNLIRPGK